MINYKTLVCLLATSFAFAQEKITKQVGEFTSIKSFDKISVQLVKSTENKVELSGAESENVELVNDNGELKVKLTTKRILKGEDVVAKVYHTKEIYDITATEGSYISSEDIFKTIDLKLSAKEGAEIKLKVDVKKLNGSLTTGGKITVEGTAQNQDYVVNAGSILKAQTLNSEQCSVTSNAGGEANVTATELVDAKVRAGGIITIYGTPRVVNEKKVMGGKINKMKS